MMRLIECKGLVMTDVESTSVEAVVSPLLDREEARVIGCLMEKQVLTPEVYPLTLNAVMLACNQKTSREPVMHLEEGAVGHCLRRLENKGLVSFVHSARAFRYDHRFDHVYQVTPPQRTVLALLLLRGAQTAPELLQRSERMHRFSDVEQLRDTLDRLARRSPALVVNLGHQAGQREDRYMHLLCGAVDPAQMGTRFGQEAAAAAPVDPDRYAALEARVAALEASLQALKDKLGES